MKAIGYQKPLPIDNAASLVNISLAKPEASGRDLLVQVRAISVNPVDTKVRANVGPEDDGYKVIGWDAVGEVVAVGDQTELFQVGDQVWYAGDITRSGSYAEYQLVDERIVGAKPASLSDAEAAAMPLTLITAWELLFDRLGFVPQLPGNAAVPAEQDGAPTPRILIVGAAGGVGSILTQLAKRLTNATVIGTASRPASEQWVRDLGADVVINHHQPFGPQLAAAGIADVSHVISLNHTGHHFAQLVEVLAPQGKLALIDDPETPIDITALKAKSVSLHWEFMYTRSMFQTWDMQRQHDLLSTVAGLVDAGSIRSTLDEHYGSINAANLKRAHAHIESGKAVGKVVLEGF